jgi:type II secretory pathway component PulF
VTPDNKRISGSSDASSQEEAASNLHRQGLTVILIRKASWLSGAWHFLNREISFSPSIKATELSYLTEEWAGLAQAGVSVEDSLGFLGASAKPRIKIILDQVRDRMKEGTALHAALASHPDCFPAAYVGLIQAGEVSGHLASTLRRLADDLSSKRELSADLRNALLYPAFLLLTSVGGISVLLTVVVPNLEEMLSSQNLHALPVATRLVIAVSHLLSDNGLAILGVTLSLLALGIALAGSKSGRFASDRLLLKTPQIGKLVQVVEAARFTRVLASMLKGGVPLSTAAPLAIKALNNLSMRHALEEAHKRILTGSNIGDALERSSALPVEALALIRMGERVGQLDAALERAAIFLEGRAARRLKALTTIMTPALTIGFGLLAGIIMYAMLSAILSINDLVAQP